ncbi:MAG: hypothetical protein P8N21_08210 [Opitutales bacterium]|nr:hypothetical protein [Opitutales bacterium]
MKIFALIILILMGGCSINRSNQTAILKPANVNDFYFEVLEIRTSMHDRMLSQEPWIALREEPSMDWSLGQISKWLSLRFSKDVEKAKLRLLKSHLNTADPRLPYTKDIEETCWAEVERQINSQLIRTAHEVSKRAKLSPNRSIQEIVHDSIAVHSP